MTNLLLPERFLQRDHFTRLAIDLVSLRGEPCLLLRIWTRSSGEAGAPDAYLPTSASVAFAVRDLPEVVAQLQDASLEAHRT